MVPHLGEDKLDGIRALVELENTGIEQELLAPSRPIVLLKKKPGAAVCAEVAPGLDELGVMLPPSPMHLLLTADFGRPLVATSGNISGEPVLTDEQEAEDRLDAVAEGWLLHNREIVRPADDAVKRVISVVPRTIRLGRGNAPLERLLPEKLEHAVLAVGGHMKNTVALAWQDRVVISPHIGELSALRSMQVFREVIEAMQNLYQVKAELVICDQHPQYASSRWAHEQDLPLFKVQHHRAHASAVAADAVDHVDDINAQGLVFTWDGVGYGDDGRLWGGETFLGSPGQWQRVASFRNFRLLGGDRVSHEPWRSAAALHWELEETYEGREAEKLAHVAWQNGLNSIESSAAGRLFDAAANMLGLAHTTSYEGEAPMRLEAIAEAVASDDSLPLLEENGLLRIDWSPILEAMKNDQQSVAFRAGYLHVLMANTVLQVASRFKATHNIDYVGLSGGVFQNRRLSELVVNGLQSAGIQHRLHKSVPANDGGISYGQIIEYSALHEHLD